MHQKEINLSEYYPPEDLKLFEEFPTYTKEQWIEEIYKVLEKFNKPKDLDQISWKTQDGIKILPFYTKEDLKELEFIYDYPGSYPFTRNSKLNQSWEILQYIQGTETEIQEKLEQTTRRGADGIIIPYGNKIYPYIFYGKPISDQNKLENIINNFKFSYYFIGESNKLIELFDLKKEKINILLDPFIELLIDGTISENFNEILKTIQKRNPEFPCLAIRGDLYSQTGIPIALELSLTISHFAELLCHLDKEKILEFLPKITIVQSTGSYYFLEIAKLRAIRRLIAFILEGFGIKDYKNPPKQLIVNSIWNHSIYDIYNNLLRNTISAMAGIIGGTNSMVILPITAVNNFDDEFSRRIAINTQLILKYESHLDYVVDPAGGSYYIENITDLIAKKAWEYFLDIEKQGGYLEAFQKNYIPKIIESKQEEIIKNIKSRKEFLLGINQYPNPNDLILKDNIELDLIGQYHSNTKIKFFRASIFFEELRLKTEELSKEKGTPVIQLIPFGKLAQQRARASFILNFFVAGGFIVNDPGDLKNKTNILEFLQEISFKEHLIKAYVLCSSDEEYLPMYLEIKEELKKTNKLILIAGLPQNADQLKKEGIFDFIHIKSNLYETLLKYQKLFFEI